jgi:hypothetical protein
MTETADTCRQQDHPAPTTKLREWQEKGFAHRQPRHRAPIAGSFRSRAGLLAEDLLAMPVEVLLGWRLG